MGRRRRDFHRTRKSWWDVNYPLTFWNGSSLYKSIIKLVIPGTLPPSPPGPDVRWGRVAQNATFSTFHPSLAISLLLLVRWFGKCRKKSKKLMFCPGYRAFFVYTITACYTASQLPLNNQKNQLLSPNRLLTLIELWNTPENIILGFWIIQIDQLVGNKWVFPSITKSLSTVMRTNKLWSPLKPTRCYQIDL